jgi:hypothetical protein
VYDIETLVYTLCSALLVPTLSKKEEYIMRSSSFIPMGLALLVGCTPPKESAPKKREPAPSTKIVTTENSPGPKSAPAVATAPTSAPALPSDPLVRERVEVTINGVKEQWTLRWEAPPTPYCDIPEDAMTCPCAGFGYGETGSLSLIRERAGLPREKLLLDPMFSDGTAPSTSSILIKSPYKEVDGGYSGDQLKEELAKRRPSTIMDLKDFNHDGLAAEFVLQVAAGPCGHQQGVLLGVDAKGGPIKVFGGAANPGAPLVLEYASWFNFLMKNSFDSLEFGCGDHGSDDEMVIHLSIKDGAFVAEEEVFDCTGKDGMRGKSISKRSL